MSDSIILLSSDDESESPPPKKLKTDENFWEKIKQFKEITTAVKGNDIINLDESGESISEQINALNSDCLVVPSDSEPEDAFEEISKNNENEDLDKTIEYPLEEKQNEADEILKDKQQNGVEEKPNGVEKIPEEKPNGVDKTPEEKHEENSEVEQNGAEEIPEKKQNGVEDLLLVETKVETNSIERPSTSKSSETQKLFEEFLETCTKSIKDSKYETRITPVFQKIKINFEKCSEIHNEPHFQKMLQEHIITAKISAPEAVVTFQRLYSYLLDHINGFSLEVSEEDLAKIRQLEHTCKLLLKKLNKLNQTEINFDDDEDSAYIQIDRYSHRLDKVYKKYCQLLKKSPHAGRLLYERVQFVYSNYNEINRAITKSYKHNKFPTYYDIEKIIRNCSAKHNLGLSEHEIKEESKHCFTKIGNLLQMRRKKELYEIHCSFIAANEDPANDDESLKNQLQKNAEEGETKLKEVINKYVKMQDNNVNVEVSEDSDDSNYKSSDSDSETK